MLGSGINGQPAQQHEEVDTEREREREGERERESKMSALIGETQRY